MAAKSYTHDNNVIDFFLRNNPGALASPATVYVGLFTVAPANPGDAGTEVDDMGTAYARKAVMFAAPANGATSNMAGVTFDAATASWGTVVAAGIWDAATAGTLLYYGLLGANKTIDMGDTASFAAGQLSVTEQ